MGAVLQLEGDRGDTKGGCKRRAGAGLLGGWGGALQRDGGFLGGGAL